jgi:hypothetical protein
MSQSCINLSGLIPFSGITLNCLYRAMKGGKALEKVNEKVNGVPETLKYGASEGTRTLDLRFTKPMLYQLSYAGLLPQTWNC